MNVTLTLDNGCFLPGHPGCVEIGCYQSPEQVADLRVYVDGEEKEYANPLKLGKGNYTLELRHTRAGGEVNSTGVQESSNFRACLTSLTELYGDVVEVDRARFDSVLRLTSGHLRPSVIKKRAFMETVKRPDGTMKPTGEWKEVSQVAHGVVVHFELGEGDNWDIVREGKRLLVASELGAVRRLEIHLAAYDETGARIYRDAFRHERKTYWFPDGCDEGPSGPYPPCQTG